MRPSAARGFWFESLADVRVVRCFGGCSLNNGSPFPACHLALIGRAGNGQERHSYRWPLLSQVAVTHASLQPQP